LELSFYEQVDSNRKMTFFLFSVFFFLILALGWVVSFLMDSYVIFPLFGVIAIVYILVSYYYSAGIVTRISGAISADKNEFKQLHNVVEEMSLAAGLPKPGVYVIRDSAINAFASGRDPGHAIICVTTGCLTRLSRAELTGVVAHEMSHIKNYDIRVMTMAAILVGLAVLLSDFLLRMFFWGGLGRSRDRNGGGIAIAAIVLGLLLAILTPLIAQVIKFAISRQREYLADASASELTRYPEGLASALRKIRDDSELLEAANKATAHLYIADPLKGQKIWFKGLFASHPPIDDRIAKLSVA